MGMGSFHKRTSCGYTDQVSPQQLPRGFLLLRFTFIVIVLSVNLSPIDKTKCNKIKLISCYYRTSKISRWRDFPYVVRKCRADNCH